MFDDLSAWRSAAACCLRSGRYVHFLVERMDDSLELVKVLLEGIAPERPQAGERGCYWLIADPHRQIAHPVRPSQGVNAFMPTAARGAVPEGVPKERNLDEPELVHYSSELAGVLGRAPARQFLREAPTVHWSYWAGVKGSDASSFPGALPLESGHPSSSADAVVLQGGETAAGRAHLLGCVRCSGIMRSPLTVVVDDIVQGAQRFYTSRSEDICSEHRGASWHVAPTVPCSSAAGILDEEDEA